MKRRAMRTVLVATGAASWAALAGCAQIAGIEDWTPLYEGPDAGSDVQADAPQTDAPQSDATEEADAIVACEAGSFRCMAAALEKCNTAGSGWEQVAVCDTADLCDAIRGTCSPAGCPSAGAYRCEGEVLQQCRESLTGWTAVATCASAALCDAQAGECGTPACADGQHRCEGATLQICNADRTGWATEETCATAALCDVANAQCVAPVCDSLEYSCDGKKLRICNSNQNGWSQVEVCGQSEICDPIGGQCDLCEAGAWQCAGATLQQCAVDGQVWTSVQTCVSNAACQAANGTCLAASCATSTAGTGTDCGAGSESCCATGVVETGTYDRSNDPAAPATVDAFRLDVFEVTVGRFRKFVAGGFGTQAKPPAAGAGAHAAVPGSGWNSSWNGNLSTSTATLQADLACDATYATWTPTASTHERRPAVCVTWYEAFAFCAWDGGRLATEAEWNLAAAGGDEQRVYPWGGTIDGTYAAYDCLGDGSVAAECDFLDLLDVGSRSPAGNGLWGHADLAGNVAEWTLDAFASTYVVPCENCAALTGTGRSIRGGDFTSTAQDVTSVARASDAPTSRSGQRGVRCVRLH